MKRSLAIILLLLTMMVLLNGCSNSFFKKPEDVVNEFMQQDNLMNLLSEIEETKY